MKINYSDLVLNKNIQYTHNPFGGIDDEELLDIIDPKHSFDELIKILNQDSPIIIQFVGKKGVTKGYQQTMANYKKSYPGKEGMGSLSFDILSVEKLSENYCFVTGKYSLVIGEDTPSGHYTLLWKKINGEWVIVSDHSS